MWNLAPSWYSANLCLRESFCLSSFKNRIYSWEFKYPYLTQWWMIPVLFRTRITVTFLPYWLFLVIYKFVFLPDQALNFGSLARNIVSSSQSICLLSLWHCFRASLRSFFSFTLFLWQFSDWFQVGFVLMSRFFLIPLWWYNFLNW